VPLGYGVRMQEPGDGVIVLTFFTAADAPAMCQGDSDPDLRRRFDSPPEFVPSLAHSLEVIRRWERERAAGERFPFAVRDATTGELLGGCELRPTAPGVANLSYWTYPAHRGRGVATRVVALLLRLMSHDDRFETVEALIDRDNAASRRVVAHNGFAEAGERDGRMVYIK
jgi:RimJ/RimL family protein N-acetyltransferase